MSSHHPNLTTHIRTHFRPQPQQQMNFNNIHHQLQNVQIHNNLNITQLNPGVQHYSQVVIPQPRPPQINIPHAHPNSNSNQLRFQTIRGPPPINVNPNTNTNSISVQSKSLRNLLSHPPRLQNNLQLQRPPSQHYNSPQRTISTQPQVSHRTTAPANITNNVKVQGSPSKAQLNNSSGGAARVHQNHVQRKSSPSLKLVSGNSNPTTNNGKKAKDSDPSTTEQKPTPRPFHKGDDVLFTTDDGTFMLGTVGMIHGQTLQILFGDGTQQLASFSRVKLLACSVEDDESTTSSVTKERPKSNSKLTKVANSQFSPDLPPSFAPEEITCGSCGVVKKIAGKKALNWYPHTNDQFNCRRCLNKSRFSKNAVQIPSMLIASGPSRGKSVQSSQISTATKPNADPQRESGECSKLSICFHCEGDTSYNDRLHCNLCERPCHLSCLAMTPTPLEGDRFWDVICSACGTQNGESGSSVRTKVFSCRRSISSWSDVAHLVLSCLSSQPEHLGERFFDLDEDVIPFIETNLDRLHLPRAYKNTLPENRKMFLRTALSNATLRFLNGKDVNKKHMQWAIRDHNNHQGYPLRVQVSSASTKPKTSKTTSATTSTTVPTRSPPSVDDAKLGFLSASTKWVQSSSVPGANGNVNRNCTSSTYSTINGTISLSKATTLTLVKPKTPPQSPPEGLRGCSRTMGTFKGLPKSSAKSNGALSPQIDRSNPPTSVNSVYSPRSSARPIPRSRTEKLVLKAKKHCMNKLSSFTGGIESVPVNEMTDNSESDSSATSASSSAGSVEVVPIATMKRKLTLTPKKTDFPLGMDTGNHKRLKLSNEDIFSGLSTHTKLSPSPKKIPMTNSLTQIFRSVAESNNVTITNGPSSHSSPVKDSRSPKVEMKVSTPPSNQKISMLGKAVKSAKITPPGISSGPEKPSLRVRKPKKLELKEEKEGKNEKIPETSTLTKKSGNGKLIPKTKVRGRPLKLLQRNNGAMPIVPNFTNSLMTEEIVEGDFSILKSSVRDLALFGVGYQIHCLPEAPSNPVKQEVQVANFLRSETAVPPAYWKSELKGANKPMRWQKSKKDLEDLDSYIISGRWIDASGQVRYYCEWKDGHGNDSDEEESGPYSTLEFDEQDLDNAGLLMDKLDEMVVEEVANPPSTSSEVTTVSSVVSTIMEEVTLDDVSTNDQGQDKTGEGSLAKSKPPAPAAPDPFLIVGLGLGLGGLSRRNKLKITNNKSPKLASPDLDIIDLTDSP